MNKYIIPNLLNACKVLKLLQENADGLSIAQITELLKIPRTTTLRIVSTFCEERFLTKENSVFKLGSGLIPIGMKALEGIDLRSASIPVLKSLADKTNETAHLAVLSDHKCLLLEVCQSPHPIRVGSPAGSLADIHCSATGKLFMAHLLKENLEEYFKETELTKRTPKTITTITALKKEVEVTLEQGFGLDDEEYAEGIRCLAAPVLDSKGTVIAAIGITGTTTRFTKRKIAQFAVAAMQAAAQLSQSLGN